MRTFRRTASKRLAPVVSFLRLALGLAVVLWSVGPGSMQDAWGSSGLVRAHRAYQDREARALKPVARTLTRCIKTGSDGVLTFAVCVAEVPPQVGVAARVPASQAKPRAEPQFPAQIRKRTTHYKSPF